MSASILFVRKMVTLGGPCVWIPGAQRLAFALALSLVTDLLLLGPAGHARGAFRLRSRLLACRALQFLAFNGVGDSLRIHQFLFNPAYFSISFFNP